MRRRSCFPIVISTFFLLTFAYLGWLFWLQIQPHPPVVEPTVWFTIPVTVPVTIPVTVEPTATVYLEPTKSQIPVTNTPQNTATAIPTLPTVYPTETPAPVVSIVIPRQPECFVMTANVWRTITRKVRCDKVPTYAEYRYVFDYADWLVNYCQGCQGPPLPPGVYPTPHGTLIPSGTQRP